MDRLFNPNNYTVIQNLNGSYSTMKMVNANIDGHPIAFPTIIYTNGQLKELSINDAIKYALQNGEYIEFNSDAEAGDFANNGYKRSFSNMFQ